MWNIGYTSSLPDIFYQRQKWYERYNFLGLPSIPYISGLLSAYQ